jgi:hypothetical protein
MRDGKIGAICMLVDRFVRAGCTRSAVRLAFLTIGMVLGLSVVGSAFTRDASGGAAPAATQGARP